MKGSRSDLIYKIVTACLSGLALVFIFAIIAVLLIAAYPSIVINGITFFTTTTWNPNISGTLVHIHGIAVMAGAKYGMLVYFVGTMASSLLALLIGVPIAVGIALFLSQFSPRRIVAPLSLVTELMAGIPSVIFGFWGILVLGPYLRNDLEPAMAKYLSFLPFFKGPVYNSGFLASGIILALMIIPIIAAISRDAMTQTPIELKEAGKALGLTDWEVSRKIVLPYAKSGIIGSSVLGLGRALGETMAVALVSGGADFLPKTFFYPINTMAAFIVTTLDGAFTDPSGMYLSALGELALILLVITMVVNVFARLLVRRGFLLNPENVVQV